MPSTIFGLEGPRYDIAGHTATFLVRERWLWAHVRDADAGRKQSYIAILHISFVMNPLARTNVVEPPGFCSPTRCFLCWRQCFLLFSDFVVCVFVIDHG